MGEKRRKRERKKEGKIEREGIQKNEGRGNRKREMGRGKIERKQRKPGKGEKPRGKRQEKKEKREEGRKKREREGKAGRSMKRMMKVWGSSWGQGRTRTGMR